MTRLPRINPDVIDEAQRSAWALGDYDNDETGCPNCGRYRLCRCDNGKRRCEKCDWCPEDGEYAPVDKR